MFTAIRNFIQIRSRIIFKNLSDASISVICGFSLALIASVLCLSCKVEPKSGEGSKSAGIPDLPTSVSNCDVKLWTQSLPASKRSAGEQIAVTFYTTEKAPKASNDSSGRVKLSDEQKCLINTIKRNRAAVDTTMLQLQRYRTIISGKRILQFGYTYPGKTPQEPSVIKSIPADTSDSQAKVKRVVWEELKHEGETSAINAYDSQLLTWGRGFGARAGLLPPVMEILFKDRTLAEAFLSYGVNFIAKEKEKGYRVVNLKTGAVETGINALRLIQTDPQLLGVFVKIAEDPKYSQQVADAQWKVVAKNAGNVPAYAHQWDDRWIALVSHITHWWPVTGWRGREEVASYADSRTIKDLLLKWGRKAASAPRSSGALFVGNADTIANFKRWGSGVAWEEISKVSAFPIPFTNGQIEDARNTQFSGMLCILAPGGASYYFYDRLPTAKPIPPGSRAAMFRVPPGDLFILVIKDLSMTDLLNSLAGMEVDEVQGRLEDYDRRADYIQAYGGRPRIAMKAALLAMPETQATEEQKRKLLDEADFKSLSTNEQNELKAFLGLK
jgi:hypothetical protein